MNLPTTKICTVVPHFLLIALYSLPAAVASLPLTGGFVDRVSVDTVQPQNVIANEEIFEIE
jgi:hypothetical protein